MAKDTVSNEGLVVVTKGTSHFAATKGATDVCWDKPKKVAKPYFNFAPTWQLGAGQTTKTTIANEPIWTMKGVLEPKSMIDHAGKGGGVVSHTYLDKATPVGHSGTLRCEGAYAIRCTDATLQNAGNTVGEVVESTLEAMIAAAAAANAGAVTGRVNRGRRRPPPPAAPPAPRQPAVPIQPAPDLEEEEIICVAFQAYIPYPDVTVYGPSVSPIPAKVPLIGNLPFPDPRPMRRFTGDNRRAGQKTITYRARVIAWIQANPKMPRHGLLDKDGSCCDTHELVIDSGEELADFVVGPPATPRPALYLRTRRGSGASCKASFFGGGGQKFTVKGEGDEGIPLFPGAPRITFWFNLEMTYNGKNAPLGVKITGEHDGFPSYEIYVVRNTAFRDKRGDLPGSRTLVYDWDAAVNGWGPNIGPIALMCVAPNIRANSSASVPPSGGGGGSSSSFGGGGFGGGSGGSFGGGGASGGW